jgi:gliding motility-associated-like protein
MLFLLAILLLLGVVSVNADTYRWIGNSGNWSDTLHWSSVNGGLPKQDDNVLFDENSFTNFGSVVNIDVAATCSTMDWSLADFIPELNGNGDLNIFGSLVLTNKMNMDYSGNIYFQSAGMGNSIITANNKLHSDIYFNGTGEWVLQDSLKIGLKSIYLNNGFLVSNGNYIACGSFFSNSASDKELNLGSSDFIIQKYNGEWLVNSALKFEKGTSKIIFLPTDPESENTFQGGDLEYCDVVFANNGKILDGNTFDRLFFNAGKTYQLESGKTQTISLFLKARGCAGLIELRPTGNSQAIIAKNSGDINVSFVGLRSIKAEMGSGNSFNASHSIDMGNNTNCNITYDSRDMYWINNTGKWSDTLHWDSSPPDVDADCVPVRYDNVFFDNASFGGQDTVKVDLLNISCSDMTWTTSDDVVFSNEIENPKLHIYGSVTMAQSMTNEFDGEVFFRDSLGGKSIESNGVTWLKDVHFYGPGSWALLDSLTIDATLYFRNGTLFSNDNTVTCNTFRSDTSSFREINLGSSVFNVKLRNPVPSWSLNDTNLVFNAGTSNIMLPQGSSTLYSYGGDTISYYNVGFLSELGIGYLKTDVVSETYAKFHKVVFGSNAKILGSNSYDTISLTPGCFYELPVGQTQTVNCDIWPSGVCDGPVLLQSVSNGSQAFLKTSDTLLIEYTSIRDINVLDEAVYIAENSVDLGNNTGWDTITNSAPGKLFWVGGDGKWSDPLHWDTISGGLGGHCIPTPYDTVVFDNLSFLAESQIVKVDQNNAFAHSMIWTEQDMKPEFADTVNTIHYLRLYGSLEFMPDVDFTFRGNIYFEARDTGQIINTTGVKFHNTYNSIFFSGLGGWKLFDSLNLGHSKAKKNRIYFMHGKLNTNGHYVKSYDFYSSNSFVRELIMDTSYIDIYNNWIVYGNNLEIPLNGSLIEIDTGYMKHLYGDGLKYNSVHMASDAPGQYILVNSADSVGFNDVVFSSDGVFKGQNGSVAANSVYFSQNGKINESNTSYPNVFSIDSLLFKGAGELYGDDTVNYTSFDSTGLINGSGIYTNTLFHNNGDIYGQNVFDTLSFFPGYFYQLEGDATQTIIDEWNIRGNNCQPIGLNSTNSSLAIVEKDTGFVFGELIEMNLIKALGGATFDAGYFSTDINHSNEGWFFNELPFRYNLGNDTSFVEGDTIYLCAEYFNGNNSTSYIWRDCDSGGIIGVDSCLMVTEGGNYCLEVNYNEGGGCTKFDTIYAGCTLELLFDVTGVSCNGFTDGAVDLAVQTGTAPFDVYWYNEGNLISTSQNIANLSSGTYVISIEDGRKCTSNDTVLVIQPDSLLLGYVAQNSCFESDNGRIELDITGGTKPYDITWLDGSDSAVVLGLPPGQYQVVVSDTNQCPAVTENIVIDEWDAIDFSITGHDLLCFNDSSGFIEISGISGGTGVYSDFGWMKDGGFYGIGQILDTLLTGKYIATVTDDFGCSRSDSVMIFQPDSIELFLNAQPGLVELGSIELEVEGGTLPYSYLWSTGAITQNVDPLGGGYYSVVVTDGNGCRNIDSIFVEVRFRILAPTAFSPNGDDLNELFFVKGLGTDLVSFELIIYDRWGDMVFKTNDIHEGWNGRLFNNGEEQPVEVYIWTASLEYSSGEKIADKGNISLLR